MLIEEKAEHLKTLMKGTLYEKRFNTLLQNDLSTLAKREKQNIEEQKQLVSVENQKRNDELRLVDLQQLRKAEAFIFYLFQTNRVYFEPFFFVNILGGDGIRPPVFSIRDKWYNRLVDEIMVSRDDLLWWIEGTDDKRSTEFLILDMDSHGDSYNLQDPHLEQKLTIEVEKMLLSVFKNCVELDRI